VETDGQLEQQIGWFLRDFKRLMDQRRYYIKGKHLKNAQTLVNLGLSERQRDDVIHALEISNYYAGPKKDDYHQGDYWEFGTKIDEIEIYIKLKIVICDNGDEYAICYSFHQAEFPIQYPFYTK
jgi:hypothetical protein